MNRAAGAESDGQGSAARGDAAVCAGIRRAIVEGRLGPGTRLREQALADEYQVSRTPVREALLRLETEGLLVIERHRGAHVRSLSEREIEDVYQLRARLEGYAAELAAERATPAHLAGLAQAAATFRRAVKASGAGTGLGGIRRIEEANAAFHRQILEASQHAPVRQLVGRATEAPLVFKAFRTFSHPDLARSALFHDLVHDAIAAGEPARAGRLMTEHVLQARDALLAGVAAAGGVAVAFAGQS